VARSSGNVVESSICSLTIDELNVGLCSDNGTSTDPSDDTTTASFTISAVDGSATGYSVEVGGSSYGFYSYGQSYMIGDLPTDVTLILTFTDNDDPSCSEQGYILQTSCSGECDLTVNDFVVLPCDDNGTSSDPSDDSYAVQFNVTADNGSGQYQVSTTFGVFGPLTYGEDQFISGFPANSTDFVITFTDMLDDACTNSVAVSQTSCSDACFLTVNNVVALPCDDNGTGTDPSDDFFDISVSIFAVNGCGNYVLYQDGNLLGTYSYDAETVLQGYPADGNAISLFAIDTCDPSCSAVFNIVAPGPCSDTCAPNVMVATEKGDVYIEDACYGVIMKSPNGSCFRFKVTDAGTWESEAVLCPD